MVLDKPEITVCLDEIDAAKNSNIEVRFHPGVDFEVKEDFVFLEGKKGKMMVIPVSSDDTKLVEGKHACHFINATNDFFWVPYFDVAINSSKEKTTVATLIVPIKNMEEAKQIAASKEMKSDNNGNLSISFIKAGSTYTYQFENKKGGLVFKN